MKSLKMIVKNKIKGVMFLLLISTNASAFDFGQISSLLGTLSGQVGSFQGMMSEQAIKDFQNALEIIEKTKKYVDMTGTLVQNSTAIANSENSNDLIKGISSATDLAFEGMTDYFKQADEVNSTANRVLQGLRQMNVVDNIGGLARLNGDINEINNFYRNGLSDVARGMSTMSGDIRNVKELKNQLMSQVKSTQNQDGKPENLAALLKALGQLLELNIDATNKVSTALSAFVSSNSIGNIKNELKQEEENQKSKSFVGNIREDFGELKIKSRNEGWNGGFVD